MSDQTMKPIDPEAALTPPERTPPHHQPSSDTAAGVSSILSTLERSLSQMGVLRSLATLTKLNQKEGFDCQSCAWPNPDEHRKLAEFCENGAKAVADEATRSRITTAFFKQWTIAQLAAQSDHWLNQQGRLTRPMLRRRGSDGYEPISWEAAFALLAEELNRLASPDEAAFYTSGRTSNETAFLYQLFVRLFGTNNLPDCSNMCHESSSVALTESIGIGKTTVRLEDFEQCDLILIIGQNPGTNHPRMLSALERAKRNGAQIISINPLKEAGLLNFINPNPQEYDNPLAFPFRLFGEGTPLTDCYLQIKINGDVAALKGLMKTMLEEETRQPGAVFDHAFIQQHTTGFDELIADLQATSWEEIEASAGLPRAALREAGQRVASSKRLILCWAMGITQHKNAVATIHTLTNLALLGGHIGRAGAGLCCVRGHSNVQGDRTMGITAKPKAEFLNALAKEFGFDPPRHAGLNTVQTIKAMHEGRVKVFFAMGGNFLSATPDTAYTAEALRRCRLTAHVSTKLNRAHLVTGEQALILPCLGRTEIDVQAAGEQFQTVEDTMMVINSTRGSLAPASEHLLSEAAIVAGLAKATLGTHSPVDWDFLIADYDRIREHIARSVSGFEEFNRRIHEGIFYLPNPARARQFATPSGKAAFFAEPITPLALAADQYLMTTIRSHDQFNTTVYGLDDRYRGIQGGRRVVFMNAEDIEAAGLHVDQWVDLTSHFADGERTAKRFTVVAYDIPRGCVATYFPEANVLVPIDSVAEKSECPTSKSVVVSIQPAVE